jgi:hypothetical protein
MWLLVLLLLDSAAPALAEFGLDRPRISPEACATDHDPLARPPRRIAANMPALSSRASHHGGLGRTFLVTMRMNQLLVGRNAATISSTRSLTLPYGLLGLTLRT